MTRLSLWLIIVFSILLIAVVATSVFTERNLLQIRVDKGIGSTAKYDQIP